MDGQTQEVLLGMALRITESAAPLIFCGSHPPSREANGIVTGLKRGHRKFSSISESEMLGFDEETYAKVVSSHDFLFCINVHPQKERVTYFPMDLRNNGAHTICVSPILWEIHNFDMFITMPLPGIFPLLIRILGNRG